MLHCECQAQHLRRRIVLTGGPGAGKTAVLELLRQSLCQHVIVLPEAAGIVFGGGFPRRDGNGARRAAQRAIFHVQRELEEAVEAEGAAIVLCDRGLADGAAYWPGPDEFWKSVGTERSDALGRYDAIIHLRVPEAARGYDHSNQLRVESAAEARAVDDQILAAWDGHPRRFVIDAERDFMAKAERALAIVRQELPECCRDHVRRALGTRAAPADDRAPTEAAHDCA